jgi:hypothetical protein
VTKSHFSWVNNDRRSIVLFLPLHPRSSASLLPPDSEVPPRKPADIGDTRSGHHVHAEHAMSPSTGKNLPFLCLSSSRVLSTGDGKQASAGSSDDPAYDEYVDEVENMRHRNKDPNSFDINKVLSHLGLPEYEYVDAQNYDYLLPTHLTYGKDQTVKLHNAKIMSCELRCRLSIVSSCHCPLVLLDVSHATIPKSL